MCSKYVWIYVQQVCIKICAAGMYVGMCSNYVGIYVQQVCSMICAAGMYEDICSKYVCGYYTTFLHQTLFTQCLSFHRLYSSSDYLYFCSVLLSNRSNFYHCFQHKWIMNIGMNEWMNMLPFWLLWKSSRFDSTKFWSCFLKIGVYKVCFSGIWTVDCLLADGRMKIPK